MKKKVLGMLLAVGFLLGSSMLVCAEETPAGEASGPAQPQVQNYQQMMTPEILASFEKATAYLDLDLCRNALVLRTDVWGTLQDADGDGIDDRDHINGCGYLDLNYNGMDDRFEMAIVNATAQENMSEGMELQTTLNQLSHQCKHGIVASQFLYDEDLNTYRSGRDFTQCPECVELYESFDKAILNLNV